jgi:CTP:molybdopterin cytidylyltransferase MocA
MLAHPLRVLAQAREARLLAEVLVVIPAEDAALASLAAEHGAHPVYQPDPASPQQHSVELGLAAAAGHAAAMIVLGDQPLLSLDMVRAVCQCAAQHPRSIVRPRFAEAPDAPGHPVVVPRRHWHLIVTPDGFRPSDRAEVATVFVDLPGASPDVDTPADLRDLEGLAE